MNRNFGGSASQKTPLEQYFVATLPNTNIEDDIEYEELEAELPNIGAVEVIHTKTTRTAAVPQLKFRHKNEKILEIPEDEIYGNPIGMMQELCMLRKWLPPTYTTEHEDGLPHERVFTISCCADVYSELGIGKSKKLAKRQAAHKMVQKILTLPTDEGVNFKTLDDDYEVADRFSGQKSGKSAFHANASRKISQFHKNFQGLTGVRLEKLKALSDNDCNTKDAIKWLQEVAAENKLDVIFVPIDEKSKTDKYQCLVQISTLPVAICPGSADTKGEAQLDSAVKMLQFLKTMTSSSS